MESPRELLVHELSDLLSAERITSKLLPELRKEATHPDVRAAFEEHIEQTRGQIGRLEEAFKLLGEKPEKTTCFGAEGFKQEHEALHEEEPAPEVLEMANLLGAAKTEHYEIASYTGLAQLANDLGERDVAALLKETLAEEQAMAKRVNDLARELGNQAKAAEKERQQAAAD